MDYILQTRFATIVLYVTLEGELCKGESIMNAINTNRNGQLNEIFVNLQQRLDKICFIYICICIYTRFIYNWINKLREIGDGSEKTSARFIRGN